MSDSRRTVLSCCPQRVASAAAPCCGAAAALPQEAVASPPDAPWIAGTITTAVGDIPRVRTALGFEDRLGAWKARWGVGRMHYAVPPGLYAVGQPTPESPVLVSANYKLSFDRLRSQLAGLGAWILVLDTEGINVWCSAGKGTFGADEIVRRLEAVRLEEAVSHRTLVLPQLSAPGVSAHEVQARSGFRVVYGPVRAEEVPAFLAAGMKATPEMRRVRFPWRDRAALIPVELLMSAKYALLLAACLLVLAGLGRDGYVPARALAEGLPSVVLILLAWLVGVTLPPVLLPWLPGRAFSAKGAWAGLALLLVVGLYGWGHKSLFGDWLTAAAWLFIIPVVASFLALNFTGSSTFTSLSGVRREVRVAIPIQVACAVVGFGLWLAGRFV